MVLSELAPRGFPTKNDTVELELYDCRTIPRDRPMIHPTCDPPACFLHTPHDGDEDEATFNFQCSGCVELLAAPSTTISQIFAIVRLWIPHVQNNFDILVGEILKRGANVNDRDGQTDLTLLHYAVRAGVGDDENREKAARVAAFLVSRGADVGAICRWTHMSPLHLAAFFDSDQVMKVLLQASRAEDVNGTCLDFDGGTSLHIAASNCSLNATKCLIEHGANVLTRDLLQRLPIDCIPNESDHEDDDPMLILIPQMRQLLKDAESPSPVKYSKPNGTKSSTSKLRSVASTSAIHSRQEPADVIHDLQGQVILQSLGLNIGDKVTLGGAKCGVLRYCGTTEFADGMWAGVELEKPIGKNNGSVNGISYFTCQENFGIFAPVTKVKVLQSNHNGSAANKGATPRVRSGQTTPSNLSRRASMGAADSNARSTQARARSVSATGRRSGSASSSATRSNSRTRAGGAASASAASASTPEAPSSARRVEEIPRIGDRVTVAGQRRGTVRFVGETQFAKGLWLGIELDDADGKNDGSVNGVSYFSCGVNRGVFAPPNRVQRAARSVSRSVSRASSTESLNSIGLTDGGGGGGGKTGSGGGGGKGNNWGRRSLGAGGNGSSAATRLSRDRTRASCGSSLGGSQTSLSSLGSSKSFASTKSAASTTTGSTTGKKEAFNKVVKTTEKTKLAKLTEGVNVFYNDQIGTVRFIGNTHFEDGIWLGIELRTPQGKNDGCVGDHRYFTCKPSYGVFVRPSKITVRGINGAKLLIDNAVVKSKPT